MRKQQGGVKRKGFVQDRRGTTAVEFAIVGPMIFVLMFWFFDVAFSLYVRNIFTHAVNTIARDVYLDPHVTDTALQGLLQTQLGRFNDGVTVTSTLETVGSIDYHVITAEMQYHFKTPPLSASPITLHAERRAPVINYQLDPAAQNG